MVLADFLHYLADKCLTNTPRGYIIIDVRDTPRGYRVSMFDKTTFEVI